VGETNLTFKSKTGIIIFKYNIRRKVNMSEKQSKVKRRRGRKKAHVEESKMRVDQLRFSSYKHLTDLIDEEKENRGIKTRPEMLRILIEEVLGANEDIRREYREQVKDARKKAGRSSKRPAEIRAIVRKEMKPRTWYTKTQIAELAGSSRKTVDRMLAAHIKYFVIDNKKFGNNRVAQMVRLRSKKERETGIEEDIPYGG